MSGEAILIYHHGMWLGENEEFALSMPDAAFREAVEAWLTVRNVPHPSLKQRIVAAEYCRRLSYWHGFWKYPYCGVKIVLKSQESFNSKADVERV